MNKTPLFWCLHLLLLSFLGPLWSCSSYIEQIHNEIDSERNANNFQGPPDKFEMYRRKGVPGNLNERGKYQEPSISSKYYKKNLPLTKRDYSPAAKQRYVASDLLDNSTDGSLWTGRGQDNFLFAKNNFKNPGDIVILKVQDKLKKEIALELARAFPEEKKKEEKGKEENKEAPRPPAQAAPAEQVSDEGKIYDKISGVVIEEIDKEHLLLRGRKDVLYKSRKRSVEVQALISRKDISDDDSVLSNNVLETQILVLR